MISKLASLKTEIKGHHFYKYDYTVNEQISCGMDENNAHSKNAISVNSKMNGSKIGHLPEGLSKKTVPSYERWTGIRGRGNDYIGCKGKHQRYLEQGWRCGATM